MSKNLTKLAKQIFLFHTVVGVFASSAFAKNFWIHAVGIDNSFSSSNLPAFYESANDFLASCRLAGLKINDECKLFLDTKKGNIPKDIRSITTLPNQSDVVGVATAKSVLAEFENALKHATHPGDQVVLSLFDHGANGLKAKSCISMSGNALWGRGEICKDQIAKILKKYKKPGVKVFISANACYSGYYAELSSSEVCIYTAADRLNPSGGFNLDPWSGVKMLMESQNSVTLSDLRRLKWFDRIKYSEKYLGGGNGGFASQAIQKARCEKLTFVHPTKRMKAASLIEDLTKMNRPMCHNDDTEDELLEKEIAPIMGVLRTLGAKDALQDLLPRLEKLKSRGLSYEQIKLVEAITRRLERNHKEFSEFAEVLINEGERHEEHWRNEIAKSEDVSKEDIVSIIGEERYAKILSEREKEPDVRFQPALRPRRTMMGIVGGLGQKREERERLREESSFVRRRLTKAERDSAQAAQEARKGKVAADYLVAQKDYRDNVRRQLVKSKYHEVVDDLHRLYELFCLQPRPFVGSTSDYLTLAALSDKIPKTDNSYRDALKCEDSFQLK